MSPPRRRAIGRARIVTPTERRILQTLDQLIPSAARSYKQALVDLGGSDRDSYRGVAHELREALRETLHHLAPDGEVMAERGFVLEAGQSRPTMKQRATFILRKRELSAEARQTPELATTMIEEISASLARSTYERGSRGAHGVGSAKEVRQMKMYVDAVLAELLEIHR